MLFKKKKKLNFFLKENLKDEIKEGLLKCGKFSYGSPKIHRWGNKGKILIGSFCSFGPNIDIYMGADHRFDFITTSPLGADTFNNAFSKAHKNFLLDRGDLIIGNDVWVGAESKIFSGIEIGTGAIIGAGSVIRKNIEPYTIVYGNPAKEISKRFNEKIIKRLLDSEWWNLNDDNINELSNLLLSNNVDSFLAKVDLLKGK